MKVDSASISVAREGELENGDATLVRVDGQRTLVCVIDALGHGSVAAAVARQAILTLEQVEVGSPEDIMQELHTALSGSRGAGATLCVFERGSLVGCGVGNVELRARGGMLSPVLSQGVLGVSLRKLHTFKGWVRPGMRIVLFTDGISRSFDIPSPVDATPRDACEQILVKYRRRTDDSTVMVLDTVD